LSAVYKYLSASLSALRFSKVVPCWQRIASASSHRQQFWSANRLVDPDLGRIRVLCLRHQDDGCFFTYFPGPSSKKWIRLIDDMRRPIEGGGVHLASKTDHFQAYVQRLSRIKAIESSRLMERAMGIEPMSEAWVHRKRYKL
jgi:hypothetical protein